MNILYYVKFKNKIKFKKNEKKIQHIKNEKKKKNITYTHSEILNKTLTSKILSEVLNKILTSKNQKDIQEIFIERMPGQLKL